VPAELAAISKAGTAAYLSSQGNAFSTRTASQIVQENFNPGERFRAGGPLFGVQFSQLVCGDFVRSESDGPFGPKRLPLGFSADPGGLPLYKTAPDGVGQAPVGGVGVESDGIYTLDRGTPTSTSASTSGSPPRPRAVTRLRSTGAPIASQSMDASCASPMTRRCARRARQCFRSPRGRDSVARDRIYSVAPCIGRARLSCRPDRASPRSRRRRSAT